MPEGRPVRSEHGRRRLVRRALRAGVADAVQYLRDRDGGRVRREAEWRILAGDVESPLAGVWVGAILRPPVFLAFADGAGFLSTEIAQPRSVRIAGRLSFVISIEINSCPDESFRSPVRSERF